MDNIQIANKFLDKSQRKETNTCSVFYPDAQLSLLGEMKGGGEGECQPSDHFFACVRELLGGEF
jgi:hypothetical protein